MTRLERFRRYVRAMDPSPLDRVTTEFYVDSDPRAGIVDAISTRLELTPSRRLLVVGTTGSGKTTLIRRCVERIRGAVKQTGEYASYLDVSRYHRLDTERLEGVLIAIAGERLMKKGQSGKTDQPPSDDLEKAEKALKSHARGYSEFVEYDPSDDEPDWEERDYDDGPPGRYVTRKGVLRTPEAPLQPARFSNLVEPLKLLRERLVGEASHVIFAFDSLDRLSDPARFSDAIKDDLPVLAAAGIGTIVVGPVRYSLGSDRSIRDLFDAVYVVPTVDTRSTEGQQFLSSVLRMRDIESVLPDAVLPTLVEASGGVIRDLVTLAQRAGEEAYSRGHDPVHDDDVGSAVSALGDSLAFGIDDAGLRILQAIDETGDFVIRGERELALVDQRRVLNLGTGAWRIHPALLPKLRAIPRGAE